MKKITSILLSVAILLTMAVMFTGCGGPSENAIYPKSVEVEGTNGHGKISKRLSTEIIRKYRDNADKLNNDDMYAHYKALREIYDDCRVKVVEGNDGKLSNGDTVTLKITSDEQYDEKTLEDSGFTKEEISFDEFKYEIKGLKEPKKVKVKKEELKLTYKGYSGSATAEITSTNTCPAVEYKLSQNKDLTNGDTITVTPSISETNSIYVLENDSKEFDFTVSGLPEFPDTLDGIDTSEVDNFLNDYVENGGCEPYSNNENLDSHFLQTTDEKKKYFDNQCTLDIKSVSRGKLRDDTAKYQKFNNDNRALYSKKIRFDYDVLAEDYNNEKKENVKGVEDAIVYANVVVVDGKLHLANYYYDNDSYNSDEQDTDKPYLTDYKNGREVLSYGFENVIGYFKSNSDQTTDEVYNDYIYNNDKLYTDED